MAAGLDAGLDAGVDGELGAATGLDAADAADAADSGGFCAVVAAGPLAAGRSPPSGEGFDSVTAPYPILQAACSIVG